MKLTTIAAALAVALPLAMAGAAQAAPDNTGTLELGYTRVDTSGTNPNYGFNSIEARGGLQFNKNLGVEMEGGVGVGNQTVHSGGVSVSVKEDWEVGIFGVGYLPVGHDIDLYGRLGYSRTQITASSGGFSIAGQGNGASWPEAATRVSK